MPLHTHTFGPDDGLSLLALHGVTGHGRRWRVLSQQLPGVRLIAVDLRGHGRSLWTPPWHIEQHVADALAVLDELGLAQVAVAGHSFGGAIAVHLARLARDRVDRLVLLDPALGLDPRDMLDAAEAIRTEVPHPDRSAARLEKARSWAGVADNLVDTEIAEHLAPEGDRFRFLYCPSAAVVAHSEMARPAVLPPAGLPTLLLPGAKADYVDPAWVDACRAQLGDALTVTEIDAGHQVHLERTAEVATAIRRFLPRQP